MEPTNANSPELPMLVIDWPVTRLESELLLHSVTSVVYSSPADLPPTPRPAVAPLPLASSARSSRKNESASILARVKVANWSLL